MQLSDLWLAKIAVIVRSGDSSAATIEQLFGHHPNPRLCAWLQEECSDVDMIFKVQVSEALPSGAGVGEIMMTCWYKVVDVVKLRGLPRLSWGKTCGVPCQQAAYSFASYTLA